MNNIIRIAFYILVVIAIAIGIGIFIWGGSNPTGGSSMSLIVTYILLGLAVGITLIASIGNIINHPKSSLRLIVGIVAMLVIAGIGYVASQGEVLDSYLDFGVTTAGQSKMIDAGWYLVYGALGIAGIGILVSEFSGLFKK
ncbi:MAG: hypothetical protein KJP21_06605 [Bacteroidia bacterium]|nr:hypothetical protein [Bacteroidia bacterium]NNJ54489.1 hypothetical protein [Bacteroidia bacterium]